MSQISCEKCDGKLKECKDDLPFESKALGKILVPGVHHFKCPKCGSTMIPFGGAGKLLKYVSAKETAAIKSLPIGDFVTLNEAADILGISKQAFNKHSRIKRGCIYSTVIGDRRFYYRKSVEEFKNTGKDGRITIAPQSKTIMKSVELYREKMRQVLYIVPKPTVYDKPMYAKALTLGIREPSKLFVKCGLNSEAYSELFHGVDLHKLGSCEWASDKKEIYNDPKATKNTSR